MCGNLVSMPNPHLPLSPFTQKVYTNIDSKKKRGKVALPFDEECEILNVNYNFFCFQMWL